VARAARVGELEHEQLVLHPEVLEAGQEGGEVLEVGAEAAGPPPADAEQLLLREPHGEPHLALRRTDHTARRWLHLANFLGFDLEFAFVNLLCRHNLEAR
jgi:hypothetical protein